MAQLRRFSEDLKKHQIRYFSESLKKQIVDDLEKNITTIAEVSRYYSVSRAAVYKWVYKYSPYAKKGERQIVEKHSNTKKIELLKERVKELERIVGQKQLQIDFKDKMIEIAEEEYKVDIKKKLSSKLSSGSGVTGNSTCIK
jgi:transposase